MELARYVVLNPVRVHMVHTPDQWPWRNQPSPWEKLKNRIFLGSDEFVVSLQRMLDSDASYQEIPAAQRRPPPKPLAQIAEAIFDAYASGGYSLKEIGDHFRLHYSRVSRIVKQQRLTRNKT
ncbi:hypothetical protein [Nitrosospira sp. NRS527]|uniref:hypothetical protein n=1 Tax=Nitrosospira sp. NRS527 TaxID=155925 RepID=UPI001AFA6A00|nr:hypothetical protein [Nitrosospira sp. NRS527]BCT69426.1 hypothetical protein NNRS527_03049 [Nitrosospira sp. NRS527]